MKLAYLGNC